jgi:nicotinamidase-related amidase
MDLQTAIVSIYGKSEPDFLARVAGVLKEARAHAMTVIHVRVGFRPGFPEGSRRAQQALRRHQDFRAMAAGLPGDGGSDSSRSCTCQRRAGRRETPCQCVPQNRPRDDLRAKQIDTLILLGIATSGVVLSTLLDASDADYRLIVVRDC